MRKTMVVLAVAAVLAAGLTMAKAEAKKPEVQAAEKAFWGAGI